jgi:hypothetical protein
MPTCRSPRVRTLTCCPDMRRAAANAVAAPPAARVTSDLLECGTESVAHPARAVAAGQNPSTSIVTARTTEEETV